jgi:sialic acid synthase SpsE
MINSLKNTFNCIVGYSDHTTGIDISISAVALGASIIEKHFTIDRNMDGPDHNFSILKDELENLVRSSKRVKEATLTHRYGILPTEVNTAQNLRRSIFYKKSLSKNHIIAEEDLEIKSPGIGIHPKFIDIVVGRKIKNKVSEDYPVQWEDFN